MLKILIVDDAPDRRRALQAALAAVPGVQVACVVESAREILARVNEHRPDVVLIDTTSPSRDVLEQLGVVSSTAPRPVVIFAEDGTTETIRDALKVGVSAYIVDGIAPGRLDAVMRVAIERFTAEQELRTQLAETRGELADRKVIERAKGLIMKQRKVSEEEAFKALRDLAMQRGKKIGEIARQVIDAASLLG